MEPTEKCSNRTEDYGDGRKFQSGDCKLLDSPCHNVDDKPANLKTDQAFDESVCFAFIPYVNPLDLRKFKVLIHDEPLNMLVVHRKRFASSRVQHESTHVGKECMAHRPFWMTHVLEISDGSVGVLILSSCESQDELWPSNGM